MLEKIKEVPFIDESAAVKLISNEGKLFLERNDRVIWASEKTEVPANDINCYVEAEKFFALLPNIKTMTQGTCLEVELKNGAKYELPFLTVSWETQEMPTEYPNTITFKLADLMLCTLKNLVKPELQCIYIDEQGAVSCDFISACITDTVKSNVPFLLPPDIQTLVDGRLCKVAVDDAKIYVQAADFNIITTKPTIGQEPWWESLRAMLSGVQGFTKTEKLQEGLKRLVLFGDYIRFDGTRVVSGENFEPFNFKDLGTNDYEIERLNKILDTASEISEENSNLVLKNTTSKFLISAMPEVE